MIKTTIEGKDTTKYIFFNGSEISFKREFSGQYTKDMKNPDYQNKMKYSLVLSCSKGCNIGCSFCHLTQNQKPTQELEVQEVLSNIKDVISDQVRRFPVLKTKAIKLCWMGEGEPLLQSHILVGVTKLLLDWVFENGYAKYLDGVDIATSYPKISKRVWTRNIKNLYKDTEGYLRNPNQDSRTNVRVFYSLHDSTQEGRDRLVPNSRDIDIAISDLKNFTEDYGIDFIIHYMFIDGITDSGLHLLNIIDLWRKHKLNDTQLRILRYNEGANGWRESEDLTTCLYWLKRNIPNVKVQYSSGKEVKSSCGMFSDYKA
jgi:adenine C2-methylase RlmN of 23S rRNA A2503 and tRNA A37